MKVSGPSFEYGPVSMGTTIAAVCYDEGVMFAADSRTSAGNYIANRAADKINMLLDNIFMARSGTAADTQLVRDYVSINLEQHALQLNQQVPVKTAAKMIQNILYNNKDALSAGIIVGGYDDQDGGSVYSVTLGGSLVKAPFVSSGSGSVYIAGYFDKYWTKNMNEQECREFMIRAVTLAMGRDGASGGSIRLICVNKSGAKKDFIPGNQIAST